MNKQPKKATATISLVIQTPPLMVNRKHAAAALSISTRTLDALVATGDVPPPRKIGKVRVGWVWTELEAFVESRPISDHQPGPGRRAVQADPTAA